MIKNEKIILQYITTALNNWFSFWEKIEDLSIKDQLSYSKNKTINLLWYYLSFYWEETQGFFEMPLIELVMDERFLKAIFKYVQKNSSSQWVGKSMKNSSFNIFWNWVDYDNLLTVIIETQALYISKWKLVDFIKMLKI